MGGTEAARDWFTTQRGIHRHGDPETVLAALQLLPPGDERDRAWVYLTTRRSLIAYREVVARGWPIGSGCVASAHKGVLKARLKRRGMRWSRPVAEALVALQIIDANDRWDATWAQLAVHHRTARHARARAAVPPAGRHRPVSSSCSRANRPATTHGNGSLPVHPRACTPQCESHPYPGVTGAPYRRNRPRLHPSEAGNPCIRIPRDLPRLP